MKILSLLILFISIFFLSSSFSQEITYLKIQNSLDSAKNQFVSSLALEHASVGICVIDLKTKEKIISHNEKIGLPTASTAKLFATASAFEMLGADYKPKTRIYYDNKLTEDGTLKGNLWIRGGGDVSLGSRYYNEDGNIDAFLEKWVDTLYKMGLRKIEGDLIGDGSEFGYQGIPDGWNWSDMGNYYGAGPSGLPIYDNILRFYLTLGGKIGSMATLIRVFPEVKNLNFNSYIQATNTRGDNSNIYGAPFSYDRFGTGYLPRNSTSFMVKGSLPDPELQFADELKRFLLLKGITISGATKCARNLNLSAAKNRYQAKFLIFQHDGKSVNSISWWTNMKSVNLFAEQLVCWIGKEKGTLGDSKTGTYLMERYWSSRIKDGGLNLKDGSGLSRSNAITAENFCSLLAYMNQSKNDSLFRNTMAVSGESGTMSKVCYGQTAHGRIKAKSGTMNKIKSYAGYVETLKGEQLAFAILVNNYSCSADEMLEKIEVFMNKMVKY